MVRVDSDKRSQIERRIIKAAQRWLKIGLAREHIARDACFDYELTLFDAVRALNKHEAKHGNGKSK